MTAAWRSDIRSARRAMGRRPGAAAGVVLVLALGFAFASTVFAIADPLLWRPLPYDAPDRLVVIRSSPGLLSPDRRAAGPTSEYWSSRIDLFESVTEFSGMTTLAVRTDDGVKRLRIVTVRPDLLRVLLPSEWTVSAPADDGGLFVLDRSAHAPVLRTSPLVSVETGSVLAVRGLLPPTFVFPSSPRARQPDALRIQSALRFEQSAGRVLSVAVLGRMRATATAEQVQAAVARDFPEFRDHVEVQPLSTLMAATHRRTAVAGFGASLLVTAASAFSLVNIFIARVWYRRREIATRVALGASKVDVARVILTEFAASALMGLGMAVPLLVGVVSVAGGLIPHDYAPLGPPAVTLRVAGFHLALGAAFLAAGVIPAWLAATQQTGHARAPSGAASVRLVRTLAAAAQSAVAMVVLTGGVLLGQSYFNLWVQDTGAARNAEVLSITYPPASDHRFVEQVDATVRDLQGIPGIVAVGAGTSGFLNNIVAVGGEAFRVNGRTLLVPVNQVTPRYFDALEVRLLAGRSWDTAEMTRDGLVINATLFRRIWPSGRPADAIGQLVEIGRVATLIEIVGVVEDVYDYALDVRPVSRAYRLMRHGTTGPMHFVVRTANGFTDVEDRVRRTVRRINPDAAIEDISSIGDRLARTVADRSFAALIMMLFAIAGTAVCAAGLSSVVSFVVAERTKEIAIRLAIGAPRSRVRWIVTREVIAAVAAGTAAGSVAAWWLFRGAAGQLYGVVPADPSVWVAATGLLVATAFIVVWPAASRAAGLPPLQGLQS